MITEVDEEVLLADIERQLVDDFPGVPPKVVDALLREEHARFAHSRVREFVPLLVEKNAREQLKQRSN
ncbi:hypothetical protein HMPREF0591_2063 [Mycobacterium parascrofulaceum ATCC BAA-614]|uniref:Uncharacterized protein n=1 Tax=Mycobacterium parascrofulaceum ATCC BAA-614 TaxID=525368 RepID=D5P7B9_9MYCO|nr:MULTISPECIES: hypothetical protein [Mycobacterium]EFG78027.1 hypothetical protein HMPREF0591_2063 [Mycobacterium parascrofulaceum ATCC BAA-614]